MLSPSCIILRRSEESHHNAQDRLREASLLFNYMRPFTEFILSGIEGFRVTTIS